MLNTKGLVALTELKVSWRLFKVENWGQNITRDRPSQIWSYVLMKRALLYVSTLNNHWLHPQKQDSGSNIY